MAAMKPLSKVVIYLPEKNNEDRYKRIMEGLGIWTSYYRANPHRLAVDYLNMKWLKPFQKMLLVLMFRFTYVMIIASRGMGKSQIVAAFCVLWCILYPGTKICIAAGKRGQSINCLNKIIEEFLPNSQNLRNEILRWNNAPSEGYIIFKNTSTIKVVTAADSARSARANIIVFDEFRLIKKEIIDKVLRKFKAGQRTPSFFNNSDYKDYPKEPNKEIYISSAWYKHHWSWNKFRAFFKSCFVNEEKYFLCGFPYQLPVSQGYYPLEQIREEMQEDDFDSISFSMEMDSLFFGSSENAFFTFEDLDRTRRILKPLYPRYQCDLLDDPKFKYEEKVNGEVRLLSVDVAYIPSKRNDVTAFVLMQLLPTKQTYQYIRCIPYLTTRDGGNFSEQALQLRRLFYDLDCDFVVLDTNGIGAGLYNELTQEQYDPERDITYPAWTCRNDEKMASLCFVKNAQPIIYSIKATDEFNSNAAVTLRDGIVRGKIRLLIDETEGKELLLKNKIYCTMTPEEQAVYQLPYIQTTCLINEMVNLESEIGNGGKIKVFEKSGMRKDRYSAVMMGYAIANELEQKLRKNIKDSVESLIIAGRRPKIR